MITKELFREKILLFTLRFEGGYSNDSADRGGETYRGISRVHFPNWHGWAIVDKLKPLNRGDIVNHTALKDAIVDFYYTHFFTSKKLELISSDLVALNMFDFFMHGGFSVDKLQKALNAEYAQTLKVDGIMGLKTIEAINTVPPRMLCKTILALRKAHLKGIIEHNPSQEKFERGWMQRVNTLLNMVKG